MNQLRQAKFHPPLEYPMKIIDEIPFTHHFWGGADTVQIYDLPFPQSVRLRARISGGTWSTWGYLELNEEVDYGEGGFGAMGLLI